MIKKRQKKSSEALKEELERDLPESILAKQREEEFIERFDYGGENLVIHKYKKNKEKALSSLQEPRINQRPGQFPPPPPGPPPETPGSGIRPYGLTERKFTPAPAPPIQNIIQEQGTEMFNPVKADEIKDKLFEKFLKKTDEEDLIKAEEEKTKKNEPFDFTFKSFFRDDPILQTIEEENSRIKKTKDESNIFISGMIELPITPAEKMRNFIAAEKAKKNELINDIILNDRRTNNRAPIPTKKEQQRQKEKEQREMKAFLKSFKKEGRQYVIDQMKKKQEAEMFTCSAVSPIPDFKGSK